MILSSFSDQRLRNINTGDRMSKTWLSQLLLAFLRARCDKGLPNTKMIEDLHNAWRRPDSILDQFLFEGSIDVTTKRYLTVDNGHVDFRCLERGMAMERAYDGSFNL